MAMRSKYKFSQDPTPTEPNLTEAQNISKSVKAYCSALDEVNGALEILLKSRTELKSLLLVQNVLLANRLDENRRGDNNEDDISRGFSSDTVIPAEVKCPVCFEIYSSKIFQCVNGHCICSTCCYNVFACPECRVPYGGGMGNRLVRNRALESLMGTSLKVDCPNVAFGCRERLKVREVQGHVRICQYKKKSEELLKVEGDIGVMTEGIKTLEERIEKLNKNVAETKQRWNWVCSQSQQENRLLIIQVKSENEVLRKEMQKCNLNIKLKSLIYFNQ